MKEKYEIIEKKGIGHPDTIADNLAEKLGKELEQLYIKVFGSIQHYNVDKVLVSCGKVNYNKKKMVKPVKIVFSGNATKVSGISVLLKKVVKKVLSLEISRGLKYKIYNHIAYGSPDLTTNFNNGRCNDTSFAVGFPLTGNERLVLKISNFLEEEAYSNFDIGTDHKVMFINGDVFIAIALRTSNRELYLGTKRYIKNVLKANFKIKKVFVNTGDTVNSIFNTVTGTSLEQGDAGMTGRGNRRNGLITPLKPMTMEAYHGKNNVTHIGRIYQDEAQKIADKLNKKVLLVNYIGNAIDKYKKFII